MPLRRTVEEWVTYFELESSIFHIFVEGATDRWVLESLISTLRLNSVSVVTAEEVEISLASVEVTPFNGGNRARLRAFCDLIENVRKKEIDNVRCIIDEDCDTILPITLSSKYIWRTDYANLFISFARVDLIQHMIHAVYGRELSAEDFDEVVRACKFLFAVRVIRYSRAPEARDVDAGASLRMISDKILFDEVDYIRRFVLRNHLVGIEQELLLEAVSLQHRFRGDARRYMNFDDFMRMLYAALHRRRFLRAGTSREELMRVYRAMLSPERMQEVPLFRKVSDWVKGSQREFD